MTTPSWAATLVHGASGCASAPVAPAVRGDAVTLPWRERTRYRDAALRARRRYPGALGELVARELRAAADFGYGDDGLASRLAAEVLAGSPR